jgi:hypothetical protein
MTQAGIALEAESRAGEGGTGRKEGETQSLQKLDGHHADLFSISCQPMKRWLCSHEYRTTGSSFPCPQKIGISFAVPLNIYREAHQPGHTSSTPLTCGTLWFNGIQVLIPATPASLRFVTKAVRTATAPP